VRRKKMSKYIFLFDLDTAVTKREILPVILKRTGLHERTAALMENIEGESHFKQNFLQKAEMLKDISISEVSRIVEEIELNDALVKFMQENKDRCYIITNNLDIWIDNLMKSIGMERNVYCSKALVSDDYIEDVFCVVDKSAVVSQMAVPFVAVGGGNDDVAMIRAAEIGIGFGWKQNVTLPLLEYATHVIYDEKKLIEFLQKLL